MTEENNIPFDRLKLPTGRPQHGGRLPWITGSMIVWVRRLKDADSLTLHYHFIYSTLHNLLLGECIWMLCGFQSKRIFQCCPLNHCTACIVAHQNHHNYPITMFALINSRWIGLYMINPAKAILCLESNATLHVKIRRKR